MSLDAQYPRAALLFAAGFGTRMAPLTNDRPKPLVQVGGKPLLDHALDLVEEPPLDRIVVNAHYKADQIVAHLANRNVAVSHETDEILDTGGGLVHAMPLLRSDPVITLNTDAVWTGPNPVKVLCSHWNPCLMDALLLLVPHSQAVGHAGKGDFVLGQDGTITPGPGAIYTGLQIIKTTGIESMPAKPFSMWALWNRMLDDGRLFGTIFEGGWCDVGRPSSIALAEKMLREFG